MRTLCAMVLFSLSAASLFGKEPVKPPEASPLPAVELNDAESKFAELLSGANLVGYFTTDRSSEGLPKRESYGIIAARKIADEKWIVDAKMSYKGVDIPIPVPVDVYWAGTTPMLQVTDLTIPLLGSGFSARVLFYEDRYAGTWQHGKIGGHLFGKTERAVGSKALPDSGIAPTSKVP